MDPGKPGLSCGEVLAHFEISGLLGEGGMGVLYRARDTRLGRSVAIKLLRADAVANPESTWRFVQEAKAASALNHPNIVTVYDIGEDPARGTWIAMEHLDGESLRERISRGPLSVGEALRIARDVVCGLAAAHDAGIVHRDVKPGNVMITGGGLAKVLDFGLAKLARAERAATDSELPTLSSPAVATRLGALLGTPAYMSPEQAEGRAVDARSDVFSFGAVLYEMLTGRRPFDGASQLSLLSSILRDTPAPVRSLRPVVDKRIASLVGRCLSKDPGSRPASARALLPELEACLARAEGSSRRGVLGQPGWLGVVGVLLLAVSGAGAWAWRRSAHERWARRQALPEVQRLCDADEITRAFRLAQQLRPLLTGDPQFDKLWLDVAARPVVNTEPAGAEVSVKPYADAAAEWQKLGTTPVATVDLPKVYSRFRIEKAGYAPVELAYVPQRFPRDPVRLLTVDKAPAGMVLVPSGRYRFHRTPEIELPEFWLDRYEVTNREFAAFVSGGGYRRRELWKQPFVRGGKPVSFDEAIALFRDRTGRPGPATWELGGFPEGRADHPVSGVSWYEAAAYAEFAGKTLPTLHQWYRAADISRFSDILRYSNFGGEGPRRVGQQPGLTTFGNYDMAGNVREWAWNEVAGRRFSLGGAWSDPTYLYVGPQPLDPMDRDPVLGIRLALSPTPPPAEAFGPVPRVLRDLTLEKPVDDAVFRVYERLFAYDPAEIASRVESVDDRSEYWRAEKVSFAAAYGGERIPALLFLPKNAVPPFQTVLFFPPSSAVYLRSIDLVGTRDFAFLIRSGRAVLFPVYQGTYERRRKGAAGPNALRDTITQDVLDVRRAVDFLQARTDVDHSRTAFYGLSLGADIGVVAGAVESRLRALLLVGAGSDDDWPAEVDLINFAPRVRQPVLMINGRLDFGAPLETAQRPLFRLLGAPEKNKKHVLFDSGHVPPWPDVMRESLDWLDQRLGPVSLR